MRYLNIMPLTGAKIGISWFYRILDVDVYEITGTLFREETIHRKDFSG